MSNVRRLMGRLNAESCRFDIGRGGIPDLTPQDIAGAIGMIRNPLAKAVLCMMWWEDGAALTNEQTLADLRARIWEEQGSRAMAHTKAKWALAHAKGEYAVRNRTTDTDRQEIQRLESAEQRTKSQSWPMTPGMYSLIVRGVLLELKAPRKCPDCAGRGSLQAVTGPIDCSRCDTTGKVAYPNTRRALALGIDEAAYRRIWSRVYEWAFALVNDLEQSAARDLKSAIDGDSD